MRASSGTKDSGNRYVPKSGTVKERKEEPASLSNEEQSYIEEYLKDIDQMQERRPCRSADGLLSSEGRGRGT